MASQKPPSCHKASAEYAVNFDRVHRILGASRHIAAGRAEPRRDHLLISMQQVEQAGLGWILHRDNEPPSLCVTFFGQLLFDHLKGAANLFPHKEKLGIEQRLLGVDHHIYRHRPKSF